MDGSVRLFVEECDSLQVLLRFAPFETRVVYSHISVRVYNCPPKQPHSDRFLILSFPRSETTSRNSPSFTSSSSLNQTLNRLISTSP